MKMLTYANIAALAGLCVWYGVLVLLGPKTRWRWFGPLLAVAFGGLSFRGLGWYMATVHPLVNGWLGGLWRFVLDVGLREEIIKVLFALPVVLSGRRTKGETLAVGAFVGLGFACAENRQIFALHSEPTLLVGRLLATALLHGALTAVCAVSLAKAIDGRACDWLLFISTVLMAAFAHGVFDWAPTSHLHWLKWGGSSWLSILMVLASAAWFWREFRCVPVSAQSRHGALVWFVCGVSIHLLAALVISFTRWGSFESLKICAWECAVFAPIAAAVVVALSQVSRKATNP